VSCGRRLAGELGLDRGRSSPRCSRLILVQTPPCEHPPRPPTGAATTNLPASFVDWWEDEAVSEVRTLLGSGRLVTLTGPGGVARQRLALEVAARLAAVTRRDVAASSWPRNR